VTSQSDLQPRSTLIEGLDAATAAGDALGFTFIQDDDSHRTIGFRSIVELATERGRRLRARGIVKGDRVALIIPEADEFVLSFFSCAIEGVVAVPLYPPLSLARLDAYLDATIRILNSCGARLLITTPRAAKVLWSIAGRVPSLTDIVTVEALDSGPAAPAERIDIRPEDPLFLQFTSGSTAAPKGVRVSHRKLCANGLSIMRDGLKVLHGRDKGVSWLPLYHDMGLIGFVLSPMLWQFPVVFLPTLTFLRRPSAWLDTLHTHRGTVTFGPNFAFARLLKRVTDAELDRWDLSCVRVLGCGAEPINASVLRQFCDRFARAKLRPEAVVPAYGMAEATLAMTFKRQSQRIRIDTIDPDAAFERGEAIPTAPGTEGQLEVVSCGRAFPNHEIAVFDEQGAALPDRKIGEIRFRGPSVASGYFETLDDPSSTFDGNWLHTGDLGYVVDGEVFISGRKKDVVIVNGKNYYPQALEWVVEETPHIRKGNAVVFSVPGETSEELVIVAETAADKEQHMLIQRAVIRNVQQSTGLVAREVVLLGVGVLPKTSSGKVQRRKTREHYLSGLLGREGVRLPGAMGEKTQLAKHVVKSLFGRVRHRLKQAMGKGAAAGDKPDDPDDDEA
jgi:fatty-acyl-CoA synthase